VALSEEDKRNKRFVRVDELDFPEHAAVQGWLKDYAQAVLVVRQVFTNKDGSTGRLHLVCSDLTCDYGAITTGYKKRWQVEVFHKSLKSNAGLARSPTQTRRTQSNHVFMAIYAVFKLQCLSIKTRINPFALRLKLLINTSRSAYGELQHRKATA
jgi:Archaeal putative transposase ISC1217